MEFACTKCGLCCQNIAHIKELRDFDRGDGVCKHLNLKTKECEIYAARPEICRVELMFEKYFYEKYSKKEFYALNAKACNLMQENAGLGEEFRVVIKE